MPADPVAHVSAAHPLVAYAVASAVVCWLVVVVPLAGRARYRALATAPRDRAVFYRRALARQWSLVALVVGALGWLGEPLSRVGLRWPADGGASLPSVVVPVLLALGVVTAVLRVQAARRPGRAIVPRLLRPVAALLPATRRERWWFAAVALTAGIGEEVLYRGLLMWWLLVTVPALGTTGAIVGSAVVFGAAHAYQGAFGVAVTGAAGYVLASLYVATGSLLAPMVVHALVDLRVLLLLPGSKVPAPVLTSAFPADRGVAGGAE